MLKENLSFIGVCALVFAALLGLAYLFERTVCHDLQRRSRSRNISYVAMFSALGGVLMLLEIPLFFAPGFYKMDLSELPVLMSAFYLGPVAGVITELLKVLLKLLLKGTSTAFVGDFANFVVGCTFVLPAAVIYHHHKTRRTAIIGMAVGTLCMTVFGSLFNALYLIPVRRAVPADRSDRRHGPAVNKGITSVPTLVLFAVVPFNLIKGIVDWH
ncbi:MAG: ECF transporter S component [Oscillospiraceae bacterium]